MSEISFEVKPDALALIQNTQIEANFEEVKAALTEMVEPYKTMVVTEDGIAAAKADRAKLRKVSTRIDDVRKAVKKAYQEPLTAFENRCKELVAVITDGSDNLDRQVKRYEEQTADEKIEKLRAEYAAMTDDETESYLPWGIINNPKWRNAGYKYDDAVAEIAEAVDGTRNDLETIRSMGGDDTPYLLDVYRQTRNLSAVIRKASELKTMRQREEQREREADRIRQAQASNTESAKTSGAVYEPQPGKEEMAQAEMYCVSFRVSCTKGQLIALGQYMREHGIKYEKA